MRSQSDRELLEDLRSTLHSIKQDLDEMKDALGRLGSLPDWRVKHVHGRKLYNPGNGEKQ